MSASTVLIENKMLANLVCNRRSLVRYIISGSAVALIYLVFFGLLQVIDASSAVRNSAVAFVVAVVCQYVLQGAFTFGRPLLNGGQIARFLVTVTVGFLISSCVVGFVGPSFGVSPFISSLAVVVLLPVFNFVVFSIWVFVGFGQKPESLT